jgi:hypothetical protein
MEYYPLFLVHPLHRVRGGRPAFLCVVNLRKGKGNFELGGFFDEYFTFSERMERCAVANEDTFAWFPVEQCIFVASFGKKSEEKLAAAMLKNRVTIDELREMNFEGNPKFIERLERLLKKEGEKE